MIYCDRCQRWFPHERAYEQHTEDSCSHWICDDCEVDFGSEKSLTQHYTNSPKHHYCQECDRHFDDVGAKVQHMRAKHWYCETHNRVRGSHGGIQMTWRASHDSQSIDCEIGVSIRAKPHLALQEQRRSLRDFMMRVSRLRPADHKAALDYEIALLYHYVM
jgi:hypothetical protein